MKTGLTYALALGISAENRMTRYPEDYFVQLCISQTTLTYLTLSRDGVIK